MQTGSILTRILTLTLIFMMGFTIIPTNLMTWSNSGNISNPLANPANALVVNSGNVSPIKTVAFLTFEGNVLDESKTRDNGIVIGNANYSKGKIGNYSFSFDGLTHIALANPSEFAFDKQFPFTISFWMKMAPNNNTDMYLVSNANTPTSPGISIFKSHLSNGLTFKFVNQFNKAFQVSSTYDISDNAWHLVMCTYDGSGNQKGMRIYTDGALQAAGTGLVIYGTFVTNLSETIGSTVSGPSSLVGTLDHLQILTYILSPSDMANFWGNPQLFPPILQTPVPTKSGVSLSWLPVIGAVRYEVYRDGVNITRAMEPYPSYYNFGLKPSTTHHYSIIAVSSTGGKSTPSNVTATTLATSLNPQLRIISFPINLTSTDIAVLRSNMQSNDGITSIRLPYLEFLDRTMQISGLKHFPFATRIAKLDNACDLGLPPSMSELVNQSKQANQSGYNIETVVYDIEGWCWTPKIEQQNYVSAIDNASNIVHSGGFKFGLVPTHVELLQWYPNIHWQNVDYLFIQAHKSVMTRESGYTLFDPTYISDTENIINYSRSQNPSIKIILTFNPDWAPVGSMIYALDHFKNKVQGIDFYGVPPNNAFNFAAPFPTWDTPPHQNEFLKAVKAM